MTHAHMVFCPLLDTAENRDDWERALREARLPELDFPFRTPPCEEHEPRPSHCESCGRPVWSTKRARLTAGELKIGGHRVTRLCYLCFPPILPVVVSDVMRLF